VAATESATDLSGVDDVDGPFAPGRSKPQPPIRNPQFRAVPVPGAMPTLVVGMYR